MMVAGGKTFVDGEEKYDLNIATGDISLAQLEPDAKPKEAATKIVAALDSIDGTRADYICDGTDDQAEINAAITALGATGGTVMLLEGTYNITASINLATLTTLMGQGAGTVLRIPNGHDADLDVISASNVNRVLVADLKIDGNKANQAAGQMYGIYFATVTYSAIARCWVENLRVSGIYLETSSNNTIIDNNCQSNANDGIFVLSSNNNTIIDNNCQSNGIGIYLYTSSNNTITGNNCQSNGGGIELGGGSNNNTITGNNIQSNSYDGIYINMLNNNNTLAGNNIQSNGYNGIYLYGAGDFNYNNTITGNNIQSNGYNGIYLEQANYNNTITGNNIKSNGYNGIHLSIDNWNNTIAGNTIVGNSQATDNTYDGILIVLISSFNNVQGNTVRHAGGANQHRYGIRIERPGSNSNLVINNDLYLAGKTADYSDAGTDTVYHNNRTTAGWVP